MAVFYSFHFDRDAWRVQQIENMGVLEGQPILNAQDWEKVKAKGDAAIEEWIDENMTYKSALVVLIGAQTAGRRWVKYEIEKAWNDKRKLVGVHIHGLEGTDGRTDSKGANPFAAVKLTNGQTIADYVPVYDPAGNDSKAVYSTIRNNLKNWADNGYKPS